MNTTVEITPQDTYDTFIGSGALAFPWWNVPGGEGLGHLDAPADWAVPLNEWDMDEDQPGVASVTLNHQVVKRAVNRLARMAKDKRPEFMHLSVLRECSRFIKDPSEADFDAGMADQVLQYIVFGKVIY